MSEIVFSATQFGDNSSSLFRPDSNAALSRGVFYLGIPRQHHVRPAFIRLCQTRFQQRLVQLGSIDEFNVGQHAAQRVARLVSLQPQNDFMIDGE